MEITPNRIALFTVIENSDINIGAGKAWKEWDTTNPESEPLEEEAIKCFSSWRKNAGWLKDIDIYCICPSNKRPKKLTINAIKALNVQYIHHYSELTENLDCGYMNVPIAGQWFEKAYGHIYDHIIHIDLDMTVINPIPQEYFYSPVVIGALHERKPWSWIHPDKCDFNLESCFMISKPYEGLYWRWYEKIEDFHKHDLVSKIPSKYHAEIEEYALDALYHDYFLSYDWKILTNQYQIGVRYPIRVSMDPDWVLFHHNHLYESLDVFTEYMKMRLNA